MAKDVNSEQENKVTIQGLPPKAGRPSAYTEEIAQEICIKLEELGSLRKVCAIEGMPHRDTVNEWLKRHKDFADQYARAKEEYADMRFEQLGEISQSAYLCETQVQIGAHRLASDNLKWELSKLSPKKYGDKLDVEHGGVGGAPIMVTQVNLVPLKPNDNS